MNPNAQRVIDTCKNVWPTHKNDCSGFLKAVCTTLGVPMTAGMADDIVVYIRDTANHWEQITDVTDTNGKITTRKEELAKERADAGYLVLCGLTSAELAEAHGHVSVVISAPLVHSNINHNDYPAAYWGKLGGVGGENQGLAYSFGSGTINKVHYAAFAL